MGRARIAAGCLALGLALTACTEPVTPVPVPPERPDELTLPPAPKPVVPKGPSAKSLAMANYYTRLEARLVAQGLLRTDGGGVDTPFNPRQLQENFERIAFYDEYARGQGLTHGRGEAGRLKRWPGPVRFAVQFGDSIPEDQQDVDRAEVERYVARLARITGHPLTMAETDANFHVLYMSEDDGDTLPARVQAIVPNISPGSLNIFRNLPRSIHCLVVAFSSKPQGHEYATAIALIRAEHPSLLRRSCVHEEVAQGLGLANDSPQARPSIFNDDDEFALLTSHDEILLKLLYSPDLQPGMSLEQARPIVKQKLAGLFGGES